MSTPRVARFVHAVVGVAVLTLGGCALPASQPTPAASATVHVVVPATPQPTRTPAPAPTSSTGTVTAVIDGDTIDVDGQRIRIIGIDTPEVGSCGYAEATRSMSDMVAGRAVTLTAAWGKDDQDQYGRLLRYVDVDGVDAGLRQIEQGYAIARYDSRDGYGAHPREARYIAADVATPQYACPAPAVVAPEPAPGPGPATSCDSSYPTVCIPPYPPDLDCDQISHRRFVVRGPDPHGFDGDHDGIGCERG